MKVFNLACPRGHSFEGWFGSAEDFQSQREDGRLRCPFCDSAEIERLPSAPRLNFGAQQAPASQQTPQVGGQQVEPAPDDRTLRLNLMRRLVSEVLVNTEDVGERFAEEARRIHYNEAPDRGIRGTASETERQELEEEGIAVLRIPLPSALKGNLH